MRRCDKNAFFVHSGDRKWSTCIEFVSTRGYVFKPMIIFEDKRIVKAWKGEFPEATFAVSKNGWTDWTDLSERVFQSSDNSFGRPTTSSN